MLYADIHTTLTAWIDFNKTHASVLKDALVIRPRIQNQNITLRIANLPDTSAFHFSELTPHTITFTIDNPDFHITWFSNK